MAGLQGAAPGWVAFLEDRVGPDGEGMPVGQWVRRRWGLSPTLYRRLKHGGGIWVNGRSVPAFHRLYPGDTVALALPSAASASPEPVPVPVVYEDGHLLVVDKPAGLVMHPARGHPGGTLVNGVAHHRLARGEPPWVHPVHRLDRDTSGLVLVAKNPYVHDRLLRRRWFGRWYVACVHGHVAACSGRVEVPILDPEEGAAGTGPARTPGAGGRPACTRFRVAWRGELASRPVSVVVASLATGRTHQIRVHMASLGHPVWGDPLYGGPDPGGPRLWLHARKLWFVHPVTGRRHVLKSPLPATLPLPDAPRGALRPRGRCVSRQAE
ncbi:MAG TPA: RluA family pseudouridine synthase [Limnochordales bacterium]